MTLRKKKKLAAGVARSSVGALPKFQILRPRKERPMTRLSVSPSSFRRLPFTPRCQNLKTLDISHFYLPRMSNDADKKVEAEAEGDDDDEDLEKLQAEIKRMEEEAARITKETEELEKKKGDPKATTDGAKASASGEAPSQDGYDRD